MEKTYTELYIEYYERYNGKPKHMFPHFLTILARVHHHRTITRPRIIWWEELRNDSKNK